MGHREELLAAARRLLEERGYAHITARDLVAASGTNLASIGYHFGSKAALLNAAIEASFQDWAGRLADFAMSDPAATPLQRAGATWAASLASLPERRPILQSYIEALAQAMRVPELRAQLAAHYSRARAMVAELVARALGDGVDAADPQCRAVAALVIAACDGLAVQWMLDPDDTPDPADLAAGLEAVFVASLPQVPQQA
ncbi:MAG TPA: TetR/AcrR family transcriptional regulator [Jatrophihabitans sp.]|nr:TetR/AcrR family transcriptional regulator [Jatrophihabitans sp.]